jgi:hypothetical protein
MLLLPGIGSGLFMVGHNIHTACVQDVYQYNLTTSPPPPPALLFLGLPAA